MKKHIFILIAGFLLNACIGYGVPVPRLTGLYIYFDEIKDPRVKSIKITFKNLDGIEPQYKLSKREDEVDFVKINGIHMMIIERKEHTRDEKKFYFKDGSISFIDYKNEINSSTYELKMYINYTFFFTKKFSLIPKGNYIYEYDNMEYVTKGGSIKITDSDVKKWLDGKP